MNNPYVNKELHAELLPEFDFYKKTYLYNFDPLKPNLYMYIVKLEFTGVYIIFLIFARNMDCMYPLEPHRYYFSYFCSKT